MSRQEQTKQMRQRIIDSAIQEFNEYGYDNASLNHVCKIRNISKGIIYHYFKDKDDLYLACIKELYDTLLTYYQENMHLNENIEIKDYMQIRLSFFKEYPYFVGLFFYSLLYTPHHLTNETNEIMKDLKNYNILIYKNYLSKFHLRVSEELAIMYLDACQSSFNDFFRKIFYECDDKSSLIKEHEKLIPDWIDLMLYGIVNERKDIE